MKFLLILTIVCLVIQSYANDMNQHVNETDAEDSISQNPLFANVICEQSQLGASHGEFVSGHIDEKSPLGDVENHCVGPDCSNNQNRTQREKRSPISNNNGHNCECYCIRSPCPCRCW